MQKPAGRMASPIPVLASIAEIGSPREAWLTDIWGVVHNGVAPYAPACEALTRYRRAGGTVLLLSNAPRPAANVIEQLDRLGVPRSAWDGVLTSGDAARALVGTYSGKRVFALGPERDLALYDGLGVALSAAAEADAVSCTGLFDDESETPDDYAELLAALAARKLPMVCANPDLTVERGSKTIYCAGALAVAYEALGGAVAYAGKPYLPIYDLAFEAIAGVKGRSVDRNAVLAIGDGIATDIKGAAAAGIDSVFVASGPHAAKVQAPDRLADLFPDPAVRPIAALPALVW